MFSDDMMRNREQRRPCEHRREPRNWLLKRNFKSTIIRRFDTQRCNICFTRNNSRGIVNVRLCQIASKGLAVFGSTRAASRGQNPLPSEADRLTTANRYADGKYSACRRQVSPSVQPERAAPAFTVHPYQTFKQIQHNLRGGILLYLLRVERARVAMIVVTKDLLRASGVLAGTSAA